jgi:hypothetical protein
VFEANEGEFLCNNRATSGLCGEILADSLCLFKRTGFFWDWNGKPSVENSCFHFLVVFFLLQLGGSILFRFTNGCATRFAESLSLLSFHCENQWKTPGWGCAINKTTVKITFNKAVDSVTKENFSIAGATVNAATLSDDKKSVTLTVSGLNYDTEYTVVASDILVDGKPVDLAGQKFKTPAITDLYDLELTTDAPGDAILANGADNLVITAKLKDKVTGQVDTNADNVVIAFSTTYGSLANTRVTVQDGVASVTLTSEFSQKDLVAKVDAQIIEASGDYKDLIGTVVGTKNVYFKVKLDDITPDQKPVLVSAESNQADRLTLNFNKDVTVDDFVEKDEVTGKYKVDPVTGIAVLKAGTSVTVKQGNVTKQVRGFKPVPGNSKALELILEKSARLDDNQQVSVELVQASNIGPQTTSASFILTDARKPEATSAVAQGLKQVVVKFSEPVAESEVSIDGGLVGVASKQFGEFDQATLTDSRDTLTITTTNYLAAGVHSVQLSSIYDFAGYSDNKNISTTQTLDFSVAGDDSVPTATVSVESPEQFRITFNKVVEGFDAASKVTLQKLVKGTNGAADEWKAVDQLTWATQPTLKLTEVSGSEYVLELEQDWTQVYDTSATNKNYYNDQYRLVIAKDTVTNPANGKKNAEIILPLNFDGSKLNAADTTSPVISGFEQIATDRFNVIMSEPVKLPSKDNAGDTPSQIQGTTVPTPIVEFLGKDKDGNTVTIKGEVVDYTDEDRADKNFEVKPATGQPSLQDIVDQGGDRNWTLVVRSISDDVGNTAASLTYNFVVEPKQQAGEVFKVHDANYDGVKAYLNGAANDTIVLDFTADVQYTGTVKNAVNVSNYLLDGESLPKGTKITVSDSDVPAAGGVDIVTITLPDGTLSATASHVITLNKSLESAKGTKLSGDYEISFKPIDNDVVAPVVTGVKDGETYTAAVTPDSADTDIDTVELTKDGTAVAGYALGTEIKDNGAYVLTVTDKAGNKTVVNFTVNIAAPDTTAPVVTGVTDGDVTNQDVTPDSADTDIDTVELLKDGNPVAGYTLGTAVTAEGVYKLTVTDKAGNSTVVNFTIDKTAPTAAVAASGTNDATTLDLDLSGEPVDAIFVSATTTETATVTFNSATSAQITVANAGAQDGETVVFKVVDEAGNEQQYTATFDATAGTWSLS